MRIYLHPDLRLTGKVLTDTRLGIRYVVTTDTAWLLQQLSKESRVGRIVLSAARQYGITAAEARLSVYKLIGYLDTFGGIRVTPDRLTTIAAMRMYFSWHRRHTPTVTGFCVAMVRSYGLIIALLTAVLAVITVMAQAPAYYLALPAIVMASCAVHEWGHFVTVRFCAVPCYLLSRAGYAAVVYTDTTNALARRIAASGPLAAAGLYAVLAIAIQAPPLRMAIMATATIHLCGILPFFADGKTLWRTHE